MNHYINLCPRDCDDYETLTLDVPTHYMDSILHLARSLAEEKNTNVRRSMSDLFKKSYTELMEKVYVRKNRKTKKW